MSLGLCKGKVLSYCTHVQLQIADRARANIAPGEKSDHITFYRAFEGWKAAQQSQSVIFSRVIDDVKQR